MPSQFGFFLLCLALQRACLVTSQGLVWPPRLLPGPGSQGRKSLLCFTSWAGGRSPIHTLPLGEGLSGSFLLWSVLGAFLSQSQDPLMGNFKGRPLIWPQVPFCPFWHMPNGVAFWPMLLALEVLTPFAPNEFTEVRGHMSGELTALGAFFLQILFKSDQRTMIWEASGDYDCGRKVFDPAHNFPVRVSASDPCGDIRLFLDEYMSV